MRFLVDAQLPQRLARWLQDKGHDALHTRDLPTGNRTEDADVNDLSLRERRVIVTKDTDFVDTFLLARKPHKLLLVVTGNIDNADLEGLFERNLEAIVSVLEASDYVELGRDRLVIHEVVSDEE